MLRRLRSFFGHDPTPQFRPRFHAGPHGRLAAYDGQPFEVLRYAYLPGRGEFWLIRFRDGTEHHVEPECVEAQTNRP